MAPPSLEYKGPLAECVLPGVNLTFGVAYPLLIMLCDGMYEYKNVASRVLNRFKLLWDLMLTKETDLENALALAALLLRFIEAFAAFWSLLGVYQKKNLISRLVESRVVMKKIIDFHQAIDKMILEINPELEQELVQWREQNRIDWEQQRSDMKAQLDDARAMGDALKDGGLAEMLTILKYETRYRQNETEQSQMAMLEAAINRLEFTAQMIIEEVPSWFIPAYEVKYANPEELEEGTFGKVAHCTIMNGARAIIKLMLEDSDAARKRFLSEATIWKSLDYPHVIRLYYICHVGKPTFFVCEDAEGGNFADYFKAEAHRGSMWRRFHEASLGLLFLHDKKIVHGNLKCNNLLIGADGKAKISDFGFAFHRSASKRISKKAQVEGVRWKSPECLRGDEENPNFKSDVFSFGLCIIEAFTNEVPWGPAATDDNITDAAFSMQGPARPAGMSDNLWSLVESMVRSDPDVRITMDEAEKGLKDLLKTDIEDIEPEGEVSSEVVAYCNGKDGAKCGFALAPNDVYCGGCGAKVDRKIADELQRLTNEEALRSQPFCKNCSSMSVFDNFCSTCGQSVQVSNLMDAAQSGLQETVERLVNDGVPLDEKNFLGETALILAASMGHTEVVRILLDAGASVNVVDNDGETAMTLAIKNNHDEVVMEVLRDKDARMAAMDLLRFAVEMNESEKKKQKASAAVTFDDLKILCSPMYEAQVMIERVCYRYLMAKEQFETSCFSDVEKANKTISFRQFFEKIQLFLANHANKRIIPRFVGLHEIIDICGDLHRDLDKLLSNIGIFLDSDDWIPQWEQDAVTMRQQLVKLLNDKKTLLDELSDMKSQGEALTLLLYACNDPKSRYSDEEKSLIRGIVYHIASFTKLRIQALPAWFVPSHKVQLIVEFARGSYASIHRGKWNGADAVIKCPLEKDNSSRELFMEEIEIWRMLQHPNIVMLFGACHVERLFFVCEYASKGTLSDTCSSFNDVKTEEYLIWEMLHQAACGLEYMHTERKVVHGDLKCNNILIDADGNVKLADFGLSFKFSEEAASIVLSEPGALAWKASEIISGEIRGSFASDVYSFGMCIVEALKGQSPWGSMPDTSVRYKVIEKRELPKQPEDMSEEQWDLVQKMCAWNPSNRIKMKKVTEMLKTISEKASNEFLETSYQKHLQNRENNNREKQ